MKWKNIVHIGKYELRNFHNSQWLKLVYHNMTDLTGFANEAEAMNCNTENRYSILNEINDKYKISGKFEFILEYPEIDKNNLWRQTDNPLEIEEAGEDLQGFTKIHTDIPSDTWGGLSKTIDKGKSYCLLNGTPKRTGVSSISYAVGTFTNTWLLNGTEPRSNIPVYKFGANIQYLWIKIPSTIQKSCKVIRNAPFTFQTTIYILFTSY